MLGGSVADGQTDFTKLTRKIAPKLNRGGLGANLDQWIVGPDNVTNLGQNGQNRCSFKRAKRRNFDFFNHLGSLPDAGTANRPGPSGRGG